MLNLTPFQKVEDFQKRLPECGVEVLQFGVVKWTLIQERQQTRMKNKRK